MDHRIRDHIKSKKCLSFDYQSLRSGFKSDKSGYIRSLFKVIFAKIFQTFHSKAIFHNQFIAKRMQFRQKSNDLLLLNQFYRH